MLALRGFNFILGTCMKFYIPLVSSFLLIACGYKPISHYTKEVFGEGMYVEVQIVESLVEASAKIKDSMNLAILNRFGNAITRKDLAKTYMKIEVTSLTNVPISYDANGFVSTYRVSLSLDFTLEKRADSKESTPKKFHSKSSSYYDYSVSGSSAILVEEEYVNALNNACTQAIDKLISQSTFFAARVKAENVEAAKIESSDNTETKPK